MKKPAGPKKPELRLASRPKLTREVSAMAWVENGFGHVLMVRQAQGNRVWTLPGGKVRGTEELAKTLEREVREEIGIGVSTAPRHQRSVHPAESHRPFLGPPEGA